MSDLTEICTKYVSAGDDITTISNWPIILPLHVHTGILGDCKMSLKMSRDGQLTSSDDGEITVTPV
ncbi:hypothetical protein FBZ96_105609 [Bradyrhizobium stylosanthis]|uniref:Uncharacterized protein n=1 Tax=Bradyrhizobium stylosanthis TaxID=1803665 RepID=A0A560DPA9_9BRAD|nr:hypothetical protein FBZ96_105609 [Bradyrhizobium stylosanthis]